MNTRKIRWIAAVSVAALIAVSGCKNASEVKGRDELIVGEAVDFASYEPIGIIWTGLGFLIIRRWYMKRLSGLRMGK